MKDKVFLRLLSDYIDGEMETAVIEEFEKQLEDEYHHCFFNTFKKTIALCKEMKIQKVSYQLHSRVIRQIEIKISKSQKHSSD